MEVVKTILVSEDGHGSKQKEKKIPILGSFLPIDHALIKEASKRFGLNIVNISETKVF